MSQAAIAEAIVNVDDKTARALRQAAAQIRDFHERQKQQSWFTVREDGALVGSKVEPLESVGIYVPGGRALYPSSVLMNALPAAVAGVKRIVCVTPPTADGTLDPAILEACRISGVTEIYAVGGAQAIAALAYGTESIAPVAKITGPGNAYVAAAKKVVSGDVGIDMIAGPSEVCVVADSTADPALVAIDLMAQAEHDPLAACYLVTFDAEYADEVERMVERHLKSSTRAEITAASLADQGLVVVCDTMEQAMDTVNVIASEHLELHVDHAFDLLGAVRNAGAIFLGAWTPEAVGDYAAGPNHTLPTGGTARYASPLSVDEFEEVERHPVLRAGAGARRRHGDHYRAARGPVGARHERGDAQEPARHGQRVWDRGRRRSGPRGRRRGRRCVACARPRPSWRAWCPTIRSICPPPPSSRRTRTRTTSTTRSAATSCAR